ncbi:hypothetical protein [Bifidobacterium longum]|uniref:hypothetical protein n=1 Tax=Bifidobacterium longum TaxID=216816 RepID=UPI0020732DB1|nr:hypothetical protein [Bifidobacterium longum]MDU2403719.1 hypothetical protein [Bifidobacterium longum]MDW3165186.1 hypothetical protein [Bifidobacterium longum]
MRVVKVLMLCGLTVGCLGSVFGSKAAAGFARNLRQGQYDAIQTPTQTASPRRA